MVAVQVRQPRHLQLAQLSCSLYNDFVWWRATRPIPGKLLFFETVSTSLTEALTLPLSASIRSNPETYPLSARLRLNGPGSFPTISATSATSAFPTRQGRYL